MALSGCYERITRRFLPNSCAEISSPLFSGGVKYLRTGAVMERLASSSTGHQAEISQRGAPEGAAGGRHRPGGGGSRA